MSWNPVPFAVTTMGQWGPKAKRFVGRVIRLRALQTKEAFADVAQEVWGAITEAVVFAVARQLDRGFPVEHLHLHLPTWNDSGGRQQGPRTLVWEDPEGGSRVWSR